MQSDAGVKYPTYGELIDMLDHVETESSESMVDASYLVAKFRESYPDSDLYIGRPGRFFETVQRISRPTKPSLRGDPKLTGSPLATYRKRIWKPPIRNCSQVSGTKFPLELSEYGLTEDILHSTFQMSQSHGRLPWQLKVFPKVGFYKALHPYIKKKYKLAKVVIGKFYIDIDSNLKAKGSRPDNVYRFIEGVTTSKHTSSDMPMDYGIDRLHKKEVTEMETKVNECYQQIEELSAECSRLRDEFQLSQDQLRNTERILTDVTNQKSRLEKSCESNKKRVKKLVDQYTLLKEENAQLQTDNFYLQSDFEDYDESISDQTAPSLLEEVCKPTHKHPPEVRMLYYTLLAQQVPASKIETIIKSVLTCFHPTLDINELHLPKKTCASYMRQQELKTVSNAHKATVLAQTSEVMLNTDGTTKNQKKLGAAVVNDMVLSINELCDGSAASAISDISKEFENLREMAHLLALPNPDSINWTLVVSSTSDSAATQKKLNKLIDDCRQKDEETYGPATVNTSTIDLIETFCAMHLGINLRKAFLSGFSEYNESKKQHNVDVLVHEFAKLFGKHGAPEYALGVSFSDFLTLMTMVNNEFDLSEDDLAYYHTCSTITLHRQVGSRYFVSASNGCKLIFLRDAALHYFNFTGKGGNKLEQAVFTKLQNELVLCQVMADSLMYYHIYADLFMLSKSTKLEKSAFSMNQHYLEIQIFLTEIIKNPGVALNKDYRVFSSEARLYGDDEKVNHRLSSKSIAVYTRLFEMCTHNSSTLNPLLVAGASKMREKLCSYAHTQLPGGVFWDPDPKVRDILCRLKPSNDVSESVLGLNDYLTTAIPNLHQMARSNLVEVKKNKALSWLSSIPEEKQHAVIDLAVKQRRKIFAESTQRDQEIATQRREKLLQVNRKRKALCKEKEELLQLHLITTSNELHQTLKDIASEGSSATAINAKKLSLLKTQVRMRRKLLSETVPITFSKSHRQRPLNDIVRELSDYIDEKTSSSELQFFLRDPRALVGRKIKQKFDEEGMMRWYIGNVVDYCSVSKTHEIMYEDDDNERYNFDLIIDLINGDLTVI